ncbi:hypothetical protein ACEWY4_025712 [Coilia grayii]|uniref:Tudor domain-containing protein 1 n=1 Tax=Coilia grayii TaxID=363190 RepID=A0ABD1ITA0_9TELE
MNHTLMCPGLPPPYRPLRRPVPRPGMVSPCGPVPASPEQGSFSAPEQLTAEAKGNHPALLIGEATSQCSFTRVLWASAGQLKCSGCKRTNYCSVSCQSDDRPAHRHACKAVVPEADHSEKLKESPNMSAAAGVGMAEPKPQGDGREAAQTKRVYLQDLSKNDIPQGAEIQAVGVEIQSPSRFFISVHSSAVEESLQKISVELQKACGGLVTGPHTPEAGEICAVKFSQDQIWYRGLVQTVSGDQQSAKVLYIDFGNEEDVPFERIKPLPDTVDRSAPNAIFRPSAVAVLTPLCPEQALQCRVAGVAAPVGGWTEECTLFLKKLLYAKSVAVQVLDVTGDTRRLYAVDVKVLCNNLPSHADKTLSSFLLEQGYAVKEVSPTTEQDIGKTEDCMLNDSVEKYLCQSDTMDAAQHPAQLFQEVGDSFTGVASCMLSPSDIICQIVENCQAIQELQVKLNEYCSCTQPSDSFKPSPGTICCALYSEDGQWYRAKVLKLTSETRASVRFIDYGNVEEVELGRLMPITAELQALAAQGIPCSLAGIQAPEGGWPEQAVLMVKRLVFNRCLPVRVLGRKAERILVAIADESNDPHTNVADTLVSMGLAVPEPTAAPSETTPQPPQSPQLKVGANSGAVPKTPVASPPVAPKLEWTCAKLPFGGQPTALVMSVIENPDDFYCHRYVTQDMQALVELSAELLKHCQGGAAPLSPVVGEPCCALFSDGSWYRALVQAVGADGKVQVYFVDYGNSSTLEAAHLRTIEQRLLTLPFLAIRCWLAGVHPVGGQWSQAATKRMRELCECRILTGRVISITERGCGVELRSDEHNIAITLISEQLAEPPALNQTGSPRSANQYQPPAHVPAAVANHSQPPAPLLAAAAHQGQPPAPLPAATNQSHPFAPRPPLAPRPAANQSLALTISTAIATSPTRAPAARPLSVTSQSRDPASSTSRLQSPVTHPLVATNQSPAIGARPPTATNQSPAIGALPPATNHTEAPAVAPSTPSRPISPGFPLDWKTEELPRDQPFVPRVAAVISPSLFYILSPAEVSADKILLLLLDVDKYCRQAPPSQTKPSPGAACCAQFSGDQKWYRAVVLDVSGSQGSVIYADFGNAEEVPLSHILPIPAELLHVPFRIVRCGLTGKEHFPSVWPERLLEFFKELLCSPLQASAKAFDGGVNLLDVTHQTKGSLGPFMLKSLHGPTAGASTPGAPDQSKMVLQPQQQGQPSGSSPDQLGTAGKGPVATPAQAKPQDTQTPKQAPPVTGNIWGFFLLFSLI